MMFPSKDIPNLSPEPHPVPDFKYHAFISYTTREEEVRGIKRFIDDYNGELRMRIKNYVFYDGWSLKKGNDGVCPHIAPRELGSELQTAVVESAFTVAFLSPGYLDSFWCSFEWITAETAHGELGLKAQGYSILPVIWKPFTTPSPFYYYVQGFNCLRIDWLVAQWENRLSASYRAALLRLLEDTRRFIEFWYGETFSLGDFR
jgi:hypothetical protein